jgi:hypothetical protein
MAILAIGWLAGCVAAPRGSSPRHAFSASQAGSPTTSDNVDDPYRPIPAPPFTGTFEEVGRDAILKYAKTLRFDDSHARSDTRRLITQRADSTLVYGPSATYAAEIGSASAGAIGHGRILTRFTLHSSKGYGEWGPGENYLWVDDVKGYLRGIIVPEDPNTPTSEAKMIRRHLGERREHAPLARILDGGGTWSYCDPQGCCERQGTEDNPSFFSGTAAQSAKARANDTSLGREITHR